jgi:hypothetical protein
MQVTNHSNNKRKMKEELLEAIYGTVERLEQKVDELSASTKNAGAENVPASNDITKLDKSINAMFIKEEEVRGKISKLRDAIVVFADLIKVELGKNEQRSKFLVDAVKQMRQGNDVSSKAKMVPSFHASISYSFSFLAEISVKDELRWRRTAKPASTMARRRYLPP